MAKIFEALQRTEEERKRKAGSLEDTIVPVAWEENAEPTPARTRAPFYKRRARAESVGPEVEAPTELNRRRISLLQPESFVAEQFRTLRGRIDSLASQRPVKTIALTSPNSGDGKSMASINLALVTAMSVGRQTLLVDCDFRCPSIHKSLGLEPVVGLAEVLLDRASLDDAILKVGGLNLHVLGIRSQPSNPSELLGSERMRDLVAEISGRYDRAIFDTPATLGLPDAKTVSELCDGIVMVVRADHTPREEVQTALDVLERRRVLGLVLNGADVDQERYGYY